MQLEARVWGDGAGVLVECCVEEGQWGVGEGRWGVKVERWEAVLQALCCS